MKCPRCDQPSLIETMTKRARGLKLDSIKNEDVARTGGPLEEAD